MRINILSLLRSIVRIAAQVAAVGELVVAATEQHRSGGGEALDLDAVRTRSSSPDASSPASSSEPVDKLEPAPAAYPADPSAAH